MTDQHPKPLNLAEEALRLLDEIDRPLGVVTASRCSTIRKALERLRELELVQQDLAFDDKRTQESNAPTTGEQLMTDPITPPPELIKEWMSEFSGSLTWPGELALHTATRSAQWGADQELEACCEEMKSLPSPLGIPFGEMASNALRAARRPKPSSLKEQALEDRIAELEAELERERLRLAACGVVALADTPESAAKARDMHPDFRSASLDDVIRQSDALMTARAADWQLEQVIQTWEQCMEEPGTDFQVIRRFDQKLKAMRPTTTQEDN
jgi:hypothetical protein